MTNKNKGVSKMERKDKVYNKIAARINRAEFDKAWSKVPSYIIRQNMDLVARYILNARALFSCKF